MSESTIIPPTLGCHFIGQSPLKNIVLVWLRIIRCHLHRFVRTKLSRSWHVWPTYASRFYGICFGQILFYFRNYSTDPIAMRLIVGLLWALDTTQLILVVQSIFDYTIMWKGNLAEVNIVSPYVTINSIGWMTTNTWNLGNLKSVNRVIILSFLLIYCSQASMAITVCTIMSCWRKILIQSQSIIAFIVQLYGLFHLNYVWF